jgi:conjugative transfer region protein TrbK
MRWPRLQTLGLIGVAIVTVLTLALDFREYDTVKPSPAFPQHTAATLQAELQRCQLLGKAALDDAACTKAWAENRRRFFGSELGATAKSLSKSEARAP